MELALFAIIAAGVALLGAVGGLFLGSLAGRRAAIGEVAGLRVGLESLTTSHGNTVDAVRDHMERAMAAAQRTASERHNIDRKTRRVEETTPTMGEAEYMAHLNAGGAALPDVEMALGLVK